MGRSEIDTAYLRRCVKTVEHALAALHAQGSEDDFAEATLKLLPRFVDDARTLAGVIEGKEHG